MPARERKRGLPGVRVPPEGRTAGSSSVEPDYTRLMNTNDTSAKERTDQQRRIDYVGTGAEPRPSGRGYAPSAPGHNPEESCFLGSYHRMQLAQEKWRWFGVPPLSKTRACPSETPAQAGVGSMARPVCHKRDERRRNGVVRGHHTLVKVPTWFARTRYCPTAGREVASVGRGGPATTTPSARNPRPSGRGGCQEQPGDAWLKQAALGDPIITFDSDGRAYITDATRAEQFDRDEGGER